MTAWEISKTLRRLADPKIACHSQRFFKTGPGQYGEGDLFLGIRAPVLRTQAKKFKDAPHDAALCHREIPGKRATVFAYSGPVISRILSTLKIRFSPRFRQKAVSPRYGYPLYSISPTKRGRTVLRDFSSCPLR